MDSFELIGLWWYPDTPSKPFAGKLSFDPASGARLEWYEPMAQDMASRGDKTVPIILGVSEERGLLSLINCKVAHRPMGHRGSGVTFDKITAGVDTIIEGYHFASTKDLSFGELTVSFNHLRDWMIIFDRGSSGNEPKYGFAPVEADLGHAMVKFSYGMSKITSQTEIYMRDDVSVVIKPAENWTLDQFRKYINLYLSNFLTLATGEANYPTEIRSVKTGIYGEQKLLVFYQVPGYAKKLKSLLASDSVFTRTILTYQDFYTKSSKYLSRWIESYDRFGSVYDLYFQTIFGRALSPALDFFLLAQAFETYHELRYKKSWTPLKTCIQNICRDFRKNLSNGDDVIVEKLIGDPEEFSERVKETRHQITHPYRECSDKVIPDGELPSWSTKMRLLLRICFLLDLDFQPDNLRQRLLSNRDFPW